MIKMPPRAALIALVLGLCCAVAPSTNAAVDLLLTPELQIKASGQTVEVTLKAQWNGSPGQQFSAVDAILSWDPAHLQFTGFDTSTAGYPWFIAGFLNDPDGINATLADGNGLFTALANPGSPATAPAAPGSMTIARFHFQALSGTASTAVQLLPTFGVFGRTRVLGPTAGSDITGNIASMANVTIVAPCSPTVGDVNGDTFITFADIASAVDVYLGFDATPAHVVAADANCDGFANGLDIQPLVNYILLWL